MLHNTSVKLRKPVQQFQLSQEKAFSVFCEIFYMHVLKDRNDALYAFYICSFHIIYRKIRPNYPLIDVIKHFKSNQVFKEKLPLEYSDEKADGVSGTLEANGFDLHTQNETLKISCFIIFM